MSLIDAHGHPTRLQRRQQETLTFRRVVTCFEIRLDHLDRDALF